MNLNQKETPNENLETQMTERPLITKKNTLRRGSLDAAARVIK